MLRHVKNSMIKALLALDDKKSTIIKKGGNYV